MTVAHADDSRWGADAIRDLRSRFGMSQEDFAARIGVRTATVNRWENRHARPQRLAVAKLDELLKEIDSNGGGGNG